MRCRYNKKIESSIIDINEIKSLKHFDTKRWDIVLKTGRIIKLPSNKKAVEIAAPNFNLVIIYSLLVLSILPFDVKRQPIYKQHFYEKNKLSDKKPIYHAKII